MLGSDGYPGFGMPLGGGGGGMGMGLGSLPGMGGTAPTVVGLAGSNYQQHDALGAPSQRSSSRSKKAPRDAWTDVEDAKLRVVVEQHRTIKAAGPGDTVGVCRIRWSQLAHHMPNRTGKQCRERWADHVDPGLKRQAWSMEEDETLFSKQAIIGNKWAQIAVLLPGRSRNQVKNRFHSSAHQRWKARVTMALSRGQGVGGGGSAAAAAAPPKLPASSASFDAPVGAWMKPDPSMRTHGAGGAGGGSGGALPPLGADPQRPMSWGDAGAASFLPANSDTIGDGAGSTDFAAVCGAAVPVGLVSRDSGSGAGSSVEMINALRQGELSTGYSAARSGSDATVKPQEPQQLLQGNANPYATQGPAEQ